MDYNQLKHDLDSKSREKIDLLSKLSTENKILESVPIERNDSLRTLSREKTEEYNRLLTKYVDDSIFPYEQKLNSIEKDRQSLKSKFLNDIGLITFDSVKKELNYDEGVYEEIEKASSILEEKIVSVYGERYKSQLETSLMKDVYKLDAVTLDDFVVKFNSMATALESVSKHRIELNKYFDKLFRFDISSFGEGGQAVIVYLIVLILIYITMIKLGTYIFVPYFAFIFCCTIYRTWVSYKIFSSLRQYKSIADNIHKVDSMISEQVNKEVEDKKIELKSLFNDKDGELLNQQNSTIRERDIASQRAKAEFKFNEEPYKRKQESLELFFLNKETTVKSSIRNIQNDLQIVENALLKISNEIENILINIKSQYFSTDVSTSCELRTDYLIDIIERKPVIWKYPRKSIMFIYEDYKEMVNLLRLFLSQTYSRISPFYINIDFVDTKYACTDFSAFIGKDKDLFSAVEPNEIKNVLESNVELIKKRKQRLFKGFKGIEDYNTFMIEQDSVIESYNFMIFLNYPKNILSDENAMLISRIGAEAGVYMMICCHKNELSELSEKDVKISDAVSIIYTLSDGKLRTKSKEFLSQWFTK